MQRLICSVGLMLVVLSAERQPARESQLEQAVLIGESYGTIYNPRPTENADFMFFQGEPVSVHVRVFNNDVVPHWLARRSAENEELLVLRSVGAGTPVGRSELALSVSEITEARSDTAVLLKKAETDRFELASKTSLVMTARLRCLRTPWPAGVYKLKVGSTVDAADGASLVVTSETVSFEIRAIRSREDRVELLRRQATRQLFAGGYVQADQLFDELLSPPRQ